MRHLILVVLFVGPMFFAGCRFSGEYRVEHPPTESAPAISDESPMVIDQTSEKMQKRFDPSMQDSDSTIRWAEKYEELSIKNNALREHNNELTLENNQLKSKIKILESELKETKEEVTQANEFLGQMHLELTKWKTDVLGFRQEIRRSPTQTPQTSSSVQPGGKARQSRLLPVFCS